MADTPRSSDNGKRRDSPAYAIGIGAMLVVLIAGIEFTRRWKTAPETSALPSGASARAFQPFPRELRDAAGEALLIPAKPQRIVSETLGTDEILLAICEPERVVALSYLAEDPNYSNSVEPARRIPGRTTLGAEQILQMKPDLIFVAGYSRAETVQLLKASKAPVFRFANFDSIEDVKANVRTVGYAIGNDEQAEKLVQQMDDDLAAVKVRASQAGPPARVLSYDLLGYTAGSATIFDDMVRAAGAVNVSAEHGVKGFSKINVEKIAEWQPDFIVLGANRDNFETARKRLLDDPVIAASVAGRNGRIIVIDNRHYLTVSQFVVRGVEDLANGIYGNPK